MGQLHLFKVASSHVPHPCHLLCKYSVVSMSVMLWFYKSLAMLNSLSSQ